MGIFNFKIPAKLFIRQIFSLYAFFGTEQVSRIKSSLVSKHYCTTLAWARSRGDMKMMRMIRMERQPQLQEWNLLWQLNYRANEL